MPLQIRRGLEAERSTLTSLNGLVVGELLYTTDGKKLYVGPGPGVFGDARDYQGVAITGYTDEDAQDAAASLFTSGTHSNITFTYVDGSDRINAAINLSNYAGVIKADSFNGSVVADNSTVLIDGTEGSFNLDGTVKGNIVPNADSTYDLGSSSYKFKDLYLSGSSIHLGNALLTASGSAINLPAGSTINGEPLNSPLNLTELSVNVIADDSTVMVNTTTKTITAGGGFVGNVTGNADSATVLDNARNIQGVSFDGSADITVITAGTGVSVLNTEVSIGQSVGTGDDVQFNSVTADLSGNVSGDVTGSVYAADTSLLVNNSTKTFNGSVDTGNATFSGSSIVSSTTFNIGTSTDIINLNLNLDGNLQIRQIAGVSSNGFLTTTISRGTHASPTALQPGDELGGLVMRGYTNTSVAALGGTITFFVDPTAVIAGGSYIKSKVAISASTDTSQNEADSLVLDSAGVTTSNAFVASKYFQLPVYADDAARSAAIPTPAKGMMVFMTSGTVPTVTNKSVVYDGSSWVALH